MPESYDQVKLQPGTAPALVGAAVFVLAECLLTRHEVTGARHDEFSLVEIQELLGSINVASVAHFSANPDFPATFDVARARLALAQGKYNEARQLAADADPAFNATTADAYEKSLLKQVESSLSHLVTTQ